VDIAERLLDLVQQLVSLSNQIDHQVITWDLDLHG
jgi:predicted methyltransferase